MKITGFSLRNLRKYFIWIWNIIRSKNWKTYEKRVLSEILRFHRFTTGFCRETWFLNFLDLKCQTGWFFRFLAGFFWRKTEIDTGSIWIKRYGELWVLALHGAARVVVLLLAVAWEERRGSVRKMQQQPYTWQSYLGSQTFNKIHMIGHISKGDIWGCDGPRCQP